MNEELNNAGTICDNGEEKVRKEIDVDSAYESKRDVDEERAEQKALASREKEESDDRLSDIAQQLSKLNELRNNKANLREVMDKRQAEFNEENKELIQTIGETKAETELVETSISEIAVKQYSFTHDKKIGFGVGIRVLSTPLYDTDAALVWAKSTGLCLKLDVTGFKKIAKVQELDFVTFEDKVTATIPSKIEVE